MKPDLKAVSVACDFEQAALNAFKNSFPVVDLNFGISRLNF